MGKKKSVWLFPASLQGLSSSLTSDLFCHPQPSPPSPTPIVLPAQWLQTHFFLPIPREGRGQEGRNKGENQALSPFWGGRGSPGRKDSQGGVGGGFWKRRRLFLSQERREHCLKLWPSWGCATSRSPTSNGLCVCLSHGADVGFKSLLSALWPVLFPSPPPQGHLPSTLPCIPLPCIVRPFSTYSPLPFLPRTPKPPPRPPQASYPNTLSPGRLAVLLPCGACPHRCRAVVSVQVSHQMGWIGSETQEWKEWGVGGAQSPREGRASSWSTP